MFSTFMDQKSLICYYVDHSHRYKFKWRRKLRKSNGCDVLLATFDGVISERDAGLRVTI